MAVGLQLCRDNSPEWPVGAAEFRAFCLGKNQKTAHDYMVIAGEADEKRRVAREFRLSDTGAQDRAKAARDKIMDGLKAKLA